jgi:hypothetical protein
LVAFLSFTIVLLGNVQKGVYLGAVTVSERLKASSRQFAHKIKTPQSRPFIFILLPRTIAMNSGGPSAASQKKRKLSGESPLNC